MKKILCVIIAIVIALSSMTLTSFAAKKVPDFELKTSKNVAKVGDIIKVEVKVAKGSRLCALAMDLVYDNSCFEVIVATSGDKMVGVVNDKYSAKRVRFSAANQAELQVETVLFSAEFKVIKTGGTFSLDAAEVCTTKTSGSSNWNDVTEDVQKKIGDYSVTVACAHAVKETVVNAEATCAKAGSKTEKCKECSWQSEPIVIPALPHKTEEVILKDATCAEAGKKAQKCKDCGNVSGEVEIPKLPHDTEKVVVKKATCVEDGLKAEKCKNCDYQSNEEKIPATGHTVGLWITVRKATKTETGLEQKLCLVCGDVVEEREIPMLPPYKLGDVNDDGFITAVDARMILRAVAGLIELSDSQKLAADVTGDGETGATDARMILQYVVGKVKF